MVRLCKNNIVEPPVREHNGKVQKKRKIYEKNTVFI